MGHGVPVVGGGRLFYKLLGNFLATFAFSRNFLTILIFGQLLGNFLGKPCASCLDYSVLTLFKLQWSELHAPRGCHWHYRFVRMQSCPTFFLLESVSSMKINLICQLISFYIATTKIRVHHYLRQDHNWQGLYLQSTTIKKKLKVFYDHRREQWILLKAKALSELTGVISDTRPSTTLFSFLDI